MSMQLKICLKIIQLQKHLSLESQMFVEEAIKTVFMKLSSDLSVFFWLNDRGGRTPKFRRPRPQLLVFLLKNRY